MSKFWKKVIITILELVLLKKRDKSKNQNAKDAQPIDSVPLTKGIIPPPPPKN